MFTKKFRKYLSIGLILLIVFVRLAGPVSILAQEADPTPTPTEEVTPTPTPPEAGQAEVTPTPTPTETTTDLTNEGTLNNDVTSGANTGENTATQSGDLDLTEAESSGDSGGSGS